jgi:hypothetical protein
LEPIHVPRPSPEAFNRNRPISDLIKAQLKHLQEVERKLEPGLRSTFEVEKITTESDAARYIAHMTRVLRTRKIARPALVPPAAGTQPAPGIALAASAEDKFDESQGKP